MAIHKVTAGAVVAKVGGTERYFYQGSILEGVSVKECGRLVDLGLATQVADPEPEKEPEPEKKAPTRPAQQK